MKYPIVCFIFIAAFFFISQNSYAQKGKNEIAIGAEIGPSFRQGFAAMSYQMGIPVKAYYGIGTRGQMMFRTGVHTYPLYGHSGDYAGTSRNHFIPLTLGFRYNLDKIYLEGSIGAARSIENYSPLDPLEQDRRYAKTLYHNGVEIGYHLGRFDIGISLNHLGPRRVSSNYFGLKALYRLGL
jgi:hypothetical protein